MYVLDEPSIGLHQRDNERLLGTLHPPAQPGQHGDRGRARRGRDPPGRLRRGHRSGRGRARRPGGVAEGRPRRPGAARPEFAHRPVPERQARHRGSGQAPAGHREPALVDAHGRPRQQPEERQPGTAGRPVDLHHRRVRLGQVDADQRHPVPGGGVAPTASCAERAGALRRDPGPGALRQGDRHRPEPDRPHAALQPGDLHRPVHADPRTVRRRAGGPLARLRPRPLLLQRQGRPLRGLPGRRRDQGGDALPAGHLRALRRLQGQALQPRNAGDPLQGQEHPRGAGHDHRGGARVLRRRPRAGAQAADADGRRPVLHQAGPERDHAVGRRGAAREAVAGAVQAPRHRPDAVHPRRADHRPAPSATSSSCWTCSTSCATTATPWW